MLRNHNDISSATTSDSSVVVDETIKTRIKLYTRLGKAFIEPQTAELKKFPSNCYPYKALQTQLRKVTEAVLSCKTNLILVLTSTHRIFTEFYYLRSWPMIKHIRTHFALQ